VIFIVVKHQVRPEHADHWADLMKKFTNATRAEPGVISFDWTRSLDDPNELVLIEAFTDPAAGAAHVQSEHFKDAIVRLSQLLSAPPQIVHADVDVPGWSTMSEFVVSDR
jgi:quinol monooxygenase YgiN